MPWNGTTIGTGSPTNGNDVYGPNSLFGISVPGVTDGSDRPASGGNGNDTLVGGALSDSLIGGAGNDVLIGDGGSLLDVQLGGLLDASINLGLLDGIIAGNDTLIGGADDDILAPGNNALGGGSDVVDGGTGTDTMVLSFSYADFLSGNGVVDTSAGINGNSTLTFSNAAGSTSVIFTGVEQVQFTDQTIQFGNLACYVTGTRVETTRGPVAVEDLRAGDVVRTVSGRHGDHAPVKWIGYRQVDLLRHPRAAKVQPVRFLAGSLGEGMPARDLVVSPDHCMWIDGALIPAHFLVNGDTIVQETHRSAVTYWHVELEHHDVLVAEGAASESYLDTGNRHAFSNGGAAEMLHADFEGSDSADRLVPRLPADGGEVVRAARARLARRFAAAA